MGLESKCKYPLTYNDREFHGVSDGFISIGDVDNCSDDDFEIVITESLNGGKIFAMGFYLGHNESEDIERLEVWNGNDMVADFLRSRGELPKTDDKQLVFMGIVSTEPITRIFYNEGTGGGDDVYIRNLYFGIYYTDK